MLIHERDFGIRLDYSGLEERMLERIKMPHGGEPEITYTLPLNLAIEYEVAQDPNLIKKSLREYKPPTVQALPKAERVEDKKKQLAEAATLTREEMMEAEMHQGAVVPKSPLAPPEPVQTGPMDLATLSDKLLGQDLALNDDDKKTVRIMYRKLTETNSKDESEDFKTVIEVLKEDPETLDKHPKFKDLVDKIKGTV